MATISGTRSVLLPLWIWWMLSLSLKHFVHLKLTILYNLSSDHDPASWSFLYRTARMCCFHGIIVLHRIIKCCFLGFHWNFNLLFSPVLKCRSTFWVVTEINDAIKKHKKEKAKKLWSTWKVLIAWAVALAIKTLSLGLRHEYTTSLLYLWPCPWRNNTRVQHGCVP